MNIYNPFDASEDKSSAKYGIEMARLISSDWFNGGYDNKANWAFTKRAEKILRLRSWMDGTADKEQFREKLLLDGDLATRKIDDTIVSFMPRYISTVVDSIKNQFHKVSAQGVDRYSMEYLENIKDELRKEMLFRQYQKEFAEKTGVDIPVSDEVPETEEELDLRAKLDFKTNYEVAIEEANERLFMLNNFDEISNLAVEDLVLHGDAVIKPEYDHDMIVKINYVDPACYIHSYNTERTRDMKGVFYCGERKVITVSELQRLIGRALDKDELDKIKAVQNRSGLGANSNTMMVVEVLDFAFRATKKKVYKKKYNKGAYKLIEKGPDWEPTEGYENRKIQDVYDTWYGGLFVIGTELLYNYRELSFLSRQRGTVQRVLTPYCHYKLSVQSLGERLEPIIKKLHVVYSKMDTLISSIKAQGVSIDLARLSEVALGNGKVLTPDEVYRIYQTSGDLLWASETIDGERSREPIQPIVISYLSDLQALILAEQNLFEKADRITGITPEKQGFAPTKGAGVKAYQMASEAAETATMLFFNGWYSLVRNVADVVTARLQDAAIYGMKPQLTQLIGKQLTNAVCDQYFKHYAQFSILIEMKPTEQEKADLVEMLNLAVQTQKIQPEDAALIKLEINNPQRAVQVFMMLQRRYRKQLAQQTQQEQMIQSQMKQQEIQAKQQAITMETRMKLEAEMMLKEREGQLEMGHTAFEWRNKILLQTLINKNNIVVAKIKADMDAQKEEAKLDRLYEQATTMSQIAEQKQVSGPSIDFTKERKPIKDENNGTPESEEPEEISPVLPGEPGSEGEESPDGQEDQPTPGAAQEEVGADPEAEISDQEG